MIKLSSAVQTLLASDNLALFYLVKIGADTQITSAPYDITMLDDGLYVAEGTLISAEPPHISNVVDRASYKLTLADPQQQYKSWLESGAVGTKVSVRVGFFNTADSVLDGVSPGNYFPQPEHTITVYKGVLDSAAYQIDPGNGSSTLAIECSSPMADLDLVNVFYSNKESLRARYPEDGAFDQVFTGSEEINMKWGKT